MRSPRSSALGGCARRLVKPVALGGRRGRLALAQLRDADDALRERRALLARDVLLRQRLARLAGGGRVALVGLGQRLHALRERRALLTGHVLLGLRLAG